MTVSEPGNRVLISVRDNSSVPSARVTPSVPVSARYDSSGRYRRTVGADELLPAPFGYEPSSWRLYLRSTAARWADAEAAAARSPREPVVSVI